MASYPSKSKSHNNSNRRPAVNSCSTDVDIVKLKMCDNLQDVKEQLADIEQESAAGGGVFEPAEPRLLSMPVEIILKICSFLDADFLNYTFTKVCRRFETILADSHIWKYWVYSKLNGGCYPPLPHLKVWEEEEIDWPEVCAEMASEKRKWENVKDTRRHIVVKDVHIASVDTVLLINNGELCVSGGRDRGLALWGVRDVTAAGGGAAAGGVVGAAAGGVEGDAAGTTLSSARPRQLLADAHEGWVWDLAADSLHDTSVVYSASWDNTVKAWDLRTGFTCMETFRCGMSALSVVTCGDVVMAGLYSKRVLSFDRRAGPRPVSSYKPHRGPVLALTVLDNKVASVSEDKTLAVWDRAAGRTLATDVALPNTRAYPVCVSWARGALYVGDSKGTLHLLHPSELRYLQSHEVWPEPEAMKPACKITTCLQSRGGLVLCSDRGEIKFLYNSYPPRQYGAVRSSTFDVTRLRYLNDILVIGTCDSALEFWVPRDLGPDTA